MATAVPYFFYSLGIFFREGLEALLVIIALAAGVRQMGRGRGARDVYAGAIAALAASMALAWAVNSLLTDNASDTLEGGFQFIAAATLFYVSSWLTARTQSDRWHEFITARLESATHNSLPSAALALTAFMAVMREGAETIVFFQGLLAGATEAVEKRAVAGGIAAAVVLLAVAWMALRTAINRIPLRSFFRATSLLLYALAIVFVGQGVASWQESGAIGATFIAHLPTIKVFGFFPTVQTLVAQAALMLFGMRAATQWRRLLRSRTRLGGRSRSEPARRAAA